MDKYELDPEKDVLFRGEFEVVKELMAALPDGAVISTLLTLENMQGKPTYFSFFSLPIFIFQQWKNCLHFQKKRPEKFPWGKKWACFGLALLFKSLKYCSQRMSLLKAAKRECDKVIDKNGPPPKGTGIKQLRENIAESKLSYEIMDDAAQAFLKTKIMDNIAKYFYMICFAAYLREQSLAAVAGVTEDDKKQFALTGGKVSTPTEALKCKETFTAYMETHKELRTICEEGKGKLQWEREIPQADLDNLQNLANTDFQANLGKIIHDIYLTGHNMFRDMPQGDHKKRAKYRFASKTLMRILPDALKGEVEGLINQKTITLDLYEILGQCTWGKKAPEGKSL